MTSRGNNFPYKDLGIRLKQMREKLQESLAEVSGAVEIELDDLSRIEQGRTRPSEEILLLLISHFDVHEKEATRLWEMAHYDQSGLPGSKEVPESTAVMIMMQPDHRVVYTDTVNVTANDHGVVLNFMQAGMNGQPIAVSRVGMSKEHATNLIKVLQRSLEGEKPKLLPARSARSKRINKRAN